MNDFNFVICTGCSRKLFRGDVITRCEFCGNPYCEECAEYDIKVCANCETKACEDCMIEGNGIFFCQGGDCEKEYKESEYENLEAKARELTEGESE